MIPFVVGFVNNFQPVFAAPALPLEDIERQSRLMRENNLMLREEVVNLENTVSLDQNAVPAEGFDGGFGIDSLVSLLAIISYEQKSEQYDTSCE